MALTISVIVCACNEAAYLGQGRELPGREDLMPGYEPFLLCDFHVHTRWSDGRLSLRETIDLYGRTGKFDVIAITDRILIFRKDSWAGSAAAPVTGVPGRPSLPIGRPATA